MWEGVGDWTKTAIYWPQLLWPSALCLSCSPVLLNQRPGGSAFCWVLALSTTSCHQGVSKLHRGSRGPLRPGVAFLTSSRLYLVCSPIDWLPVLTELYNSSTPTQSPTQSLEWHVWSSSSGNNSHAIHRSLSSGASL